MLKFRTMTNARDAQGRLLPDEQRLTPFGRFLRSTSLDELPELFCVLRGEMSLVGPRPLLMQYLDRYTPEQRRRHEVLPGITGLAQINGRNAISWEEKFAYDVQYVDRLSLWLDLNILALTIWKVIKREGISQPGQATAEEFRGSPPPMPPRPQPRMTGSDEERFPARRCAACAPNHSARMNGGRTQGSTQHCCRSRTAKACFAYDPTHSNHRRWRAWASGSRYSIASNNRR